MFYEHHKGKAYMEEDAYSIAAGSSNIKQSQNIQRLMLNSSSYVMFQKKSPYEILKSNKKNNKF